MSKRIQVMEDARYGDGPYDFWMAGTDVEADDDIADMLIKAGLAIPYGEQAPAPVTQSTDKKARQKKQKDDAAKVAADAQQLADDTAVVSGDIATEITEEGD